MATPWRFCPMIPSGAGGRGSVCMRGPRGLGGGGVVARHNGRFGDRLSYAGVIDGANPPLPRPYSAAIAPASAAALPKRMSVVIEALSLDELARRADAGALTDTKTLLLVLALRYRRPKLLHFLIEGHLYDERMRRAEARPRHRKAKKIRQGTVARLLESHCIRRFMAAQAFERLRATPVTVGPGTVSAATAHLEAVAKRLQLVNHQIADPTPPCSTPMCFAGRGPWPAPPSSIG